MIEPGIFFVVTGKPVPKQSTRIGRGHTYLDPKVKAWQKMVKQGAQLAANAVPGWKPYTGAVCVTLDFILPSRARVDVDNLSKAVLDGMKGIIFPDDSQVIDLHSRKTVGNPPGLRVHVQPAEEGNQ